MADQLEQLIVAGGVRVNKKLKDMGDGTFAEVVYAENAGEAAAATEEAVNESWVAISDNALTGTLLPGDTAMVRAEFHNHGPDPVGIYRDVEEGAQGGMTFADCARVLAMGETYVEERFAGNGQSFCAICAATDTANVAVQYYAAPAP